MNQSPYPTVVLPVGLGEASGVNRSIFPLVTHRKRDAIGLGDVYLDATLDEMIKIANTSTDPRQGQDLIDDAKDTYDRLIQQKASLEQRPQTKNPLKLLAHYRATRLFLAASKSLYTATRARSEELRRTSERDMLSLPAGEVQPLNNDPPPGTQLRGIALRLNRPWDAVAQQQVSDVTNTIASYTGVLATDPTMQCDALSDGYLTASQSMISIVNSDTRATEPPVTGMEITQTSSSSVTIINNTFNLINSIYAPNSNVQGTTQNIGGRQNAGSVIHTTMPSHSGPEAEQCLKR